MFIELRKQGKSKKYYLVHSFREGKTVVKLRRYLGKNLSETELESKRKHAAVLIEAQLKEYKEIRDPFKYILSKSELKQVEKLEKKRQFKILHLGELEWKRFSELFSYHSNAIEGSTLTLREVTNLIEHNKTPEKSAADIYEAKGVVDAIAYMRLEDSDFSIRLIKKLHMIVFQKTKNFAGQLRSAGIEVVIRDSMGNIVHRGAPSEKIESLLNELITWYRKNKNQYSGLLLAAVVHNQFENIHPFQDGNGRIGRLLLNFILLKHNLPPVNIELANRQEYYHSLQECQHKGNVRPTIELLLKEYKKLQKQFKSDHRKK